MQNQAKTLNVFNCLVVPAAADASLMFFLAGDRGLNHV
jgi:hypothetical protein